MTTKSEVAVATFSKGYNCAQSVFYAFCDDLGIDKTTGLKLACGFGGGMGRKEEVCGAVTGAIFAIGAKYGKSEAADQKALDTTYRKTRELMDGFSRKHGTYICRSLLGGCELTTDEGQKQFKQKDLRTSVCVACVKSAVEILEAIL